jgi:hypothetical protein
MHQPNDVQFTTTSLSTGVTLHYAERGDREGKPSSSSMPTSTRGSPSAECSPCSRPPTTPSRPTSAALLRPLLPRGRALHVVVVNKVPRR